LIINTWEKDPLYQFPSLKKIILNIYNNRKNMNRRNFLSATALASLAAFIPSGINAIGRGRTILNSKTDNLVSGSIKSEKNNEMKKMGHMFGLGGVAIGNGMNLNTDEQCRETLEAAWNLGIRYYDTSPWYGFCLSERRFGNFLFNQKREDYILSTKVGRLFHGDKNFKIPDPEMWKGKSPFNYKYDFSASGVRRSIEDSLQRMGVSYIDYVFVHDLDAENHDIDWLEKFEECKKGAFPELIRMREEGIIKGWGLGVNRIDPILKTINESDPDIFLSAQQYSLIQHEDAVKRLFPAAENRGVQIILGGVLNTGYLAGTPRYKYKISEVTPEVFMRRNLIQQVCDKYKVDMRTAALQFAYAPKQVTSVAVGARTKEQITQNVESLKVKIPFAFWEELKEKGVIIPEAEITVREIFL
jgi:D-threo-aldose 1-dehydrogenase